MASRMACDTDW